jgi:hypothetical protein
MIFQNDRKLKTCFLPDNIQGATFCFIKNLSNIQTKNAKVSKQQSPDEQNGNNDTGITQWNIQIKIPEDQNNAINK